MPVEDKERLADGWIRDKFKTTPVMSTYLLAFVIADFRSRELDSTRGPLVRIYALSNFRLCAPIRPVCGIVVSINISLFDSLQIRIWSQPDTYDQTQYALQFAGKAYDFFAEYFNTPEVVPKAGK